MPYEDDDVFEDEPIELPEELEEAAEEIEAQNRALIDQFLANSDIEPVSVSQALPAEHRSGYVTVIGRPNVGKSTLMNALLGEKVAIVTPKPQTTREQQLGILTRPDAQVVFKDTPGLHEARNKLGEYMVEVATGAIPDADVVLWLVDVSEPPTRADELIASIIEEQAQGVPVVLAMNKIDLVDPDTQADHQARYHALLPWATPIALSATEGFNLEGVMAAVLEHLPHGPRYYPAERLTETHVRDNAAEIIREQVLLQYEQEVPHGVAVEVTEFKERNADLTYIAATVYVERDSQKAILIGSGGAALKALGRAARRELERVLGTQVYLDLWVKVLKNWRKDEKALRRLGYRQRH